MSPRCFLASLESTGLSVQEKKRKIDFQDGGHLGFLIGTILAIFDLQVTPMLPTKYEVLFVLRFYGPVNPMGSCRARSVYLTTRLLGRLSPLSG